VVIEWRTANGDYNRLPALVADLVVVGPQAAARAAREATSTIPIVIAMYDYDPMSFGLIESFAYPYFAISTTTKTPPRGRGLGRTLVSSSTSFFLSLVISAAYAVSPSPSQRRRSREARRWRVRRRKLQEPSPDR
jgi:hypothetical protein